MNQIRSLTTYSAVLGVVLSNRRQELGIEQEEMAAKMGLSQPSYSRLESGKSVFSLDQMFMACDVLNISTEEIIKRVNRYIRHLQADGITVVPNKRANAKNAEGATDMGSLVAGAALGAIIMGLLSK